MLKRMVMAVVLWIAVGGVSSGSTTGSTIGLAGSDSRETESAPATSDWQVVETKSAEGEACLVCRQAIRDGEVVEVLYKGRRFHVSSAMMGAFEEDPERYFRLLTANSALFDEQALEGSPSEPQSHLGWLAFGLYVLLGLICGAICGYLALARGRRAVPWFFAGLAVNGIAIGALLLSPRLLSSSPEPVRGGLTKIPRTRTPVACAQCGTLHHPAAAACAGCSALLSPSVEAETART
ncbi:MAG: hypothetical protein K0U98_21070 [Deltaproteobacteria bacterium]|nr:hypothetical protein [Deltaproteobacteria bacterium]